MLSSYVANNHHEKKEPFRKGSQDPKEQILGLIKEHSLCPGTWCLQSVTGTISELLGDCCVPLVFPFLGKTVHCSYFVFYSTIMCV